MRTDGAGRTHDFLNWLTGQRVQYSIGFTLPDDFAAQVTILDKAGVWEAALEAEQQVRPGAGAYAPGAKALPVPGWIARNRAKSSERCTFSLSCHPRPRSGLDFIGECLSKRRWTSGGWEACRSHTADARVPRPFGVDDVSRPHARRAKAADA